MNAVPVVTSKPKAKPFLKWVGGKRKLVPELMKHVPAEFGTYYEPFVGGGALFFALSSDALIDHAVLSDANAELVTTYREVRSYGKWLADRLNLFIRSREQFNKFRGMDVASLSAPDIAVRMLYLNKTCFNGMYRVNKSGRFNVPFNARATGPLKWDRDNFNRCQSALRETSIVNCEFDEVEPLADDFAYFDPPYIPISATANFTAYTKAGFTYEDQVRLRDHALKLKRRGVHVLLSNSGSELVEQLYGDDFELHPVMVRRSINCKGDGRGAVKEYIIK